MATLIEADLIPKGGGAHKLSQAPRRDSLPPPHNIRALEPATDLNLLEGEDLAGDWWKKREPPEELYVNGDDPAPEEFSAEVKQWVQEIRKPRAMIMMSDGWDAPEVVAAPPAYKQSTHNSQIPTTSEEKTSETVDNVSPTSPVCAGERYSVTPSSPSSIQRANTLQPQTHVRGNVRRTSVGSNLTRSSTLTGSDYAVEIDNRAIGSFETISTNLRGPSPKQPTPPLLKHEFTIHGSFAYNAYFSPLPTNKRIVATQATQVSATAEALKKFFRKKKVPVGWCASCKENLKKGKAIRLDCRHQHCPRCVEDLIKGAMRDEKKFPPSCCQTEIPRKVIKSTLNKHDQKRYLSKAQEYRLPRDKRFYCPENTCKAWIPPITIGKGASINCATCQTDICRTCRGRAHPQHIPCPQTHPPVTSQNMQATGGWGECFKCKNMVEAVEGYHIVICGCGEKFCYSCGSIWKTCNCQEQHPQKLPRLDIFDPQSIQCPRTAKQPPKKAGEGQGVAQRPTEEEKKQRRTKAAAQAEEKVGQLKARYEALEKKLDNLHTRQRELIKSRHKRESDMLEQTCVAGQTAHFSDLQGELSKLHARYAAQKAAFEKFFKKKRGELAEKHATDEDEYWFSLQTHLRGRPNKEARQKTLMEKLETTQREEMADLVKKQEENLASSLAEVGRCMRKIEQEIERERDDREKRRLSEKKEQAKRHWAEDRWFEAIKARRKRRLAKQQEVEEKNERERVYSRNLLSGYQQLREITA